MMVVLLTTTIAFAQNNYQDVVYLKNGSIIRGTIIEQVFNESLKIETADGNLFVYKISEVEKMTKERVGAPAKHTVSSESVNQKLQSVRQTLQSSSQQNETTQPSEQEEKRTQSGIKGGISMSTSIYGNGDAQYQYRTAAYVGFFAEFSISKNFAIQPELLYSMQGDASVGLDYINVPLIFKFYVWQQRLSIDVGLQAGYMINAGKNYYKYDFLKKFEASFCGGLSYKLTDQFDVTLRSNIGLTNIVEGIDIKHSVGQLGIGYRF